MHASLIGAPVQSSANGKSLLNGNSLGLSLASDGYEALSTSCSQFLRNIMQPVYQRHDQLKMTFAECEPPVVPIVVSPVPESYSPGCSGLDFLSIFTLGCPLDPEMAGKMRTPTVPLGAPQDIV